MRIKERILDAKDLLMDSMYSISSNIDWSDKKRIYVMSIVIGFIIGNVIRFFYLQKVI